MNSSSDFGFMLRPRLDQLFAQASRNQMVYVIADIGYGKTCAVRHYVEQQQGAIVRWIQLSESDNMGSRFWENLTRVVAMDNPDLAIKLREFGFPETLSRFKQFVEVLRGAEHCSREIFVVLDDFHLAHSKEILTFAERCAYLQLPGIYVIYISRREPEINMVPLLAKDKISVITEEDLRFTDAEVTELFRQRKVPLSPQDISRVVGATKGWALALNMLSMILQRTPNQFERALLAMRKNIFKLFESEAWEDIPNHVQKAIAKLSLLSDLPAMPLQEITADTDFWENIPSLVSFIWFDSFSDDLKVHPFYLEFLQSKQHILSHEEKQDSYRQAAQWCSENGFYMDAMHYFAKSQQFERMVQTLLSYPFRLPSDASEYCLNILENLNLENGKQDDHSALFLKNYFIPLLLAGAGRYEEARDRALAVIREWEHIDSPLAIVFLYTSYSSLSYIDMYLCTAAHSYQSPAYLKKSVEYAKRSSIPPAKMTGAFINADIRSFACLVGEGADLSQFEQFLEAARQTELLIAETPYNIYAGYAELCACEYAFFKNQPDLARSHAHRAIFQAREKKQYSIVALAEKYLLRIAMQEGNVTLVKELLKQLRSHLDNPDFWNRQLYYDLYTGTFYVHTKLLELVPTWFIMDEKETMTEIRIPARELYVSVLHHIASEQYQQALTMLSNSWPREPQERFLFGELRLSLLTAVARIHTGDTEGAMADFVKAYGLSFQGVFELCFIELGKELHPLVALAQKQGNSGIPEEWLRGIERKASIYAKKAAVVAKALHVSEPISLSKREQEVLIDLYHGLSREEIAENRYLSVNTVKKILQSVYLKLGAQNNVDAIRIALENKLVE